MLTDSLDYFYFSNCAGATSSRRKCLAHTAFIGSPKRVLAEQLLFRWPFGVGVREVQQVLWSAFPVGGVNEPVRWHEDCTKPRVDLTQFGGHVTQDPLAGLLNCHIARVSPPELGSSKVGASKYSPCSAGPGPRRAGPSTRLQRRDAAQTGGMKTSAASPFPGLKRPRTDDDDGNATPPKSPRLKSNSCPPETILQVPQHLLSGFEGMVGDIDMALMPPLSRSSSPPTPLLLTPPSPTMPDLVPPIPSLEGASTSSAADALLCRDRVWLIPFETSPNEAQSVLEPWLPPLQP